MSEEDRKFLCMWRDPAKQHTDQFLPPRWLPSVGGTVSWILIKYASTQKQHATWCISRATEAFGKQIDYMLCKHLIKTL
jgi:hypothetical protein